jgi:hypothetical protein
MYAEWTDPHDIDHYYDDVNKLFSKIAAYSNVTQPPGSPIAIDAPSVSPPATPTIAAPPMSAESAPLKSGFEVAPNSIFIDGHSVGSQPEYNILRSGPPVKDGYKDGYMNRAYAGGCYSCSGETLTIILWIIIGMLIVQVVRLSALVHVHQSVLCALMQLPDKKR